jgi:hypothetical protein
MSVTAVIKIMAVRTELSQPQAALSGCRNQYFARCFRRETGGTVRFTGARFGVPFFTVVLFGGCFVSVAMLPIYLSAPMEPIDLCCFYCPTDASKNRRSIPRHMIVQALDSDKLSVLNTPHISSRQDLTQT